MGCRRYLFIQLLNPVPKEDRSNELLELLQNAYTKKRRINELDVEIESALKESDEHCSAEKYGEVVTLLEELLALYPANDDVEDQLHEILNVKARFVERDRLYNEARDAFQDKNFRICEE